MRVRPLGEYLREWPIRPRRSRDDHLVPMASALWSSPPGEILSIPRPLPGALPWRTTKCSTPRKRPVWRVVAGGSDTYVAAAALALVGRGAPELPGPQGWFGLTVGCRFATDAGVESFDEVVFGLSQRSGIWRCSTMLSPTEREVLGALPLIRSTTAVLHTDASVLPRNPRAWAAWNALVPRVATQTCTVSYCMNLLQGLSSP